MISVGIFELLRIVEAELYCDYICKLLKLLTAGKTQRTFSKYENGNVFTYREFLKYCAVEIYHWLKFGVPGARIQNKMILSSRFSMMLL